MAMGGRWTTCARTYQRWKYSTTTVIWMGFSSIKTTLPGGRCKYVVVRF